MTEVFFPNRFTVETHSGEAPEMFPNYPEELKGIAVPIEYLSHITHDKEASEIRQDCQGQDGHFKAQKKFGKTREWDGRPCGDSFRPSQRSVGYFQITDKDAVFPGYHSWWSIQLVSTSLPPLRDDIQGVLQVIKEEQSFTTFVPDYLSMNPHSRYGNHVFFCTFEGLLRAYAKARDVEIGNVCIRMGGTLRYKFEICYVLIICTNKDGRELADFSPLEFISRQFRTKGLITEDGNIENPAAIATFHPQCGIISSAKRTGSDDKADKYSYENLAFSFYFPEPSMVVENCNNDTIGHWPKSCIKKQPTTEGFWKVCKCPNEIAN